VSGRNVVVNSSRNAVLDNDAVVYKDDVVCDVCSGSVNDKVGVTEECAEAVTFSSVDLDAIPACEGNYYPKYMSVACKTAVFNALSCVPPRSFPTSSPTASPTLLPTSSPSFLPISFPTYSTKSPTSSAPTLLPTSSPSYSPTPRTSSPSYSPTVSCDTDTDWYTKSLNNCKWVKKNPKKRCRRLGVGVDGIKIRASIACQAACNDECP